MYERSRRYGTFNIISANSRLAFLENKKILRILSKDELNLADIGIGANGDCETKTALFCVIPDSDKSYNFIIGMLYTQIFQELYYQADFNFGADCRYMLRLCLMNFQMLHFRMTFVHFYQQCEAGK